MITSLYASFLGILFVVLSYRVASLRKQLRIGLGDGGEKKLTKAIRVHGNFSEYTPFALLLLYFFEMQSSILFPKYHLILIHLFGIILFFSRVYHAYGITQHSGLSRGRVVGILLTWGLILSLSILSLLCFALN